jgi:hypothetical protein
VAVVEWVPMVSLEELADSVVARMEPKQIQSETMASLTQVVAVVDLVSMTSVLLHLAQRQTPRAVTVVPE